MMCSSSSLTACDWRMGREGEFILLYEYIVMYKYSTCISVSCCLTRILTLAYISHTKDRTLIFEIF